MAPTRVVSLISSSTEMVAALGCGERLVGRSHECDHPEWVKRLPAVTAPRLDTDPPCSGPGRGNGAPNGHEASVHHVDAAALAALMPDLVITRTRRAAPDLSQPDLGAARAPMQAVLPRVVVLQPNTLADLWRDLRKVADALGVPERGVQLISRLRQRVQAVATRCAEFSPRPRVAMIERIDPLTAAGNWHPELIEMAGGIDVFGAAGDGAVAIDWAALAEADPDILWVTPAGCDLARTRAAMSGLTVHPEWRALRAVREGRVFLGDGAAFFNRPGPRMAETLEILAEAMHPRAFRFGHEGTGWARWEG